MKTFTKITIASASVVLPSIAAAQTLQRTSLTFSTLVDQIINLMNSLIPLLVGFAIIFFFIGIIRYIYKSGDAKGRAGGRSTIIWSLIGLFVIFALWGILQLMQGAFFGASSNYNDTGAPNMPVPPSNPTALADHAVRIL